VRDNDDAMSLFTRRQFVGSLSGVALVGATSRVTVRAEQERVVSAKDAVDHLLLGVSDRDAGIRWVEERTGVKAVSGGSHPGRGTRNALLSLGGRQYLEIIAPDPAQTQLPARYQNLKTLTTPRLITWAAATDNAEATAKRCRAAGLDVVGPDPGSRQRPDGKLLRWTTLAVNTDLEGVIPFFIEWGRDVIHPATDSPPGCRLQALSFAHAQPARVRETLARMGIDATVASGAGPSLTAILETPKGVVELR
jgi:hypothetical protein